MSNIELTTLNVTKEAAVTQAVNESPNAKHQREQQQKFRRLSSSSSSSFFLRSSRTKTGCILFLFLLSSAVIATQIIYMVKARHPTIDNIDVSTITKWQDLNLEDIGQWCLQPNITTCQCTNPIEPIPRHGHKTWTEAHLENVQLAHDGGAFLKNAKGSKNIHRMLDVVFVGDSITEGWRGTSFGRPVDSKQENVHVFHDYFNTDMGGPMDGLVLGIAGDKSSNLLWRIQNGELPETLTAKVFWVLIGTNDFLKATTAQGERVDQCSEEVVLMGIRRVVEEMRMRKPDCRIVVNGLLPRSDLGGGMLYKKGEKTVMDAIDVVNHHLKEYCEKSPNHLEYFDASNIFLRNRRNCTNTTGLVDAEEEEEEKYGKYIPLSLMEDSLHPTPLGYKLWAEQIRRKIKSLTDGTLVVA